MDGLLKEVEEKIAARLPQLDRMASAWLIRRLIDPKAKFRFVASRGHRHKPGELRFDMFDGEFTHPGEPGSFEVLAARFEITDAAVRAIAEIVHDIDLKDEKYGRSGNAGFEHLINGIAMAHPEDEARLQRAGSSPTICTSTSNASAGGRKHEETHMMVAMMLVAAAAGAPDWKPVQQIFGFDGSALPGGVIRFNMPRSDLRVTVGDVAVKPGLALGGWAAFAPMGKGSAMIMGDLVLTADEVPRVTNALRDGGVEVTAIHNHLLGESPQILYLHLGGSGDPVKMGQVVVKAVGLTKTPMPPPAAAKADTDLGFDQAAVEKAMGGKGSVSGGCLHFNLPRAEKVSEGNMVAPPSFGMGTAINFQPTGNGKAAIAGDFAMTAREVEPVLDVLRQSGIAVTALHSHALDDVPRLFYMHFWANDDAVKLAQALGAAVGRTNVKR